MWMRSFLAPLGTPETVIGGDLGSKHFRVGPQSKLRPIADAADESKTVEANAIAAKTTVLMMLSRKAGE
jgi:hypothetical protein